MIKRTTSVSLRETDLLTWAHRMVRRVTAGLRASLTTEIMRPLLEPILHPSRWRIRALGLSTALGHPLFYFFWDRLLPQPYESEGLRLLMCALGLALLLFRPIYSSPPSAASATVYTLIFWITLPLFFSWMFLCNGANTVWLASLGAMYLIYYHLTDWRIATLGCIAGNLVAWLAFRSWGPVVPPMTGDQLATCAIVLGFCWYMALMLGLSSSNLRREQINNTLATMGIMAHELRTPLATMSLIGDAVRNEARPLANGAASKLDLLGTRLHSLVRNMNHQIDTQIANARILRLPMHKEAISAAQLIQAALRDYPYRSTRERECVVLQVHRDFRFRGSSALFSQVVDNLVKNALRSLAAATSASKPGDLLVEIGTVHDRGRIVFSDQGVGIGHEFQQRIFEPFFSTDRGTGHGLGLAFCRRVVLSARGAIRVKSEPARGAIFTIELPLLP